MQLWICILVQQQIVKTMSALDTKSRRQMMERKQSSLSFLKIRLENINKMKPKQEYALEITLKYKRFGVHKSGRAI